MAVNFCTNCGQRLQMPARFCNQCGTPVSTSSDRGESPRAGQSPEPGHRPVKEGGAGSEQQSWGVNMATLDALLGYSLGQAPLDTKALLLGREQSAWRQWLPLDLITGLQGLQVVGSNEVTYGIVDVEYSYVPYDCRIRPLPEVKAAVERMEKEAILNLKLILYFKPADHGGTTDLITGKWVTCINNREMADIRMITQAPLSGWMLKRRMQEHEAWATRLLAKVQDAEVKRILNQVIASLRAAASKLPEGLLHHVYCIAYVTLNDECLPTILTDEEPEPAKTVPPAIHELKTASMRFSARQMVAGGGGISGFVDSRLRSLDHLPPGVLRYGTGNPGLPSAGIDGSKPKWHPFGH